MKLVHQTKFDLMNNLWIQSKASIQGIFFNRAQSTKQSEFNCKGPDEIDGFYHLFQNSAVFFQTYGHQDNPLLTSAFE